MTFKEVLQRFHRIFLPKEKGAKFEKLDEEMVPNGPHADKLQEVWLWEEFQKDFDLGIDWWRKLIW